MGILSVSLLIFSHGLKGEGFRSRDEVNDRSKDVVNDKTKDRANDKQKGRHKIKIY